MIKFTGLLLLILLFSSHTIEIIASELADYPPVLNICRGINMVICWSLLTGKEAGNNTERRIFTAGKGGWL